MLRKAIFTSLVTVSSFMTNVSEAATNLQSDDLGDICEMDGGSWGRAGSSWICSYVNGDKIVCRPNAWRSQYICRLQRTSRMNREGNGHDAAHMSRWENVLAL